MQHKKYFDRFTIGVTMFFIMILVVLGNLSKFILKEANLLLDNQSKMPFKIVFSVVFSTLIIYSLYCFYRFMINANRGLLFTEKTSALWKRISTIYIVFGIILIALGFYKTEFLSGSLISGFLSSIAYSFSKIFKESTEIKQENDLTI